MNDAVSNVDHVFGEVLDHRDEASLGVKPRFGAQFFVERLQAFNYSGYSKLEISLCTI